MVSKTAPRIETATLVAAAIIRADRTKTWTAEKVGIPPTTFARKINGHTEFLMSELLAIAEVLEVHPASLIPSSFRASEAA